MRSPEGRKRFRTYFESAVTVPGPEVEEIASAAREGGAHLVIGVIERDGGTLYCTALFFGPDGLLGKHRKLMPTANGASHLGLWRRYHPAAFRYARGKNGSRHLLGKLHASAAGGHVCQGNPDLLRPDCRRPRDLDTDDAAYRARRAMLRALGLPVYPSRRLSCKLPGYSGGRSANRVDAWRQRDRQSARRCFGGAGLSGEKILTADVDPGEIAEGKFDLDVVGHYARPDVFRLEVNEKASF